MNRISAFILPLLFLILSPEANAQKPTTAASNISFSNVFCNQLQLNWTNGNGTERLVLARKGALINSFPIDDSVYFAHDTLGKGKKLGSNNYVVYSGMGSSTTVYGLDTNSKYYFAVIEFNQSGSNYYYLTTNYPESNTTTEKIYANFSIDIPYQCIGGNSFKFTNLSTNSLGQPMTYLWNFGGDSISSAKDPTHSYSKGALFDVKLMAFSQGCLGTRIRTDTVLTPAYANFELDTLPGNDSIQCLSNLFKFRNTSVVNNISGVPIDESNYTWTYGDGTKSSGYDAQKKFLKAGIYEVKLVTQRRVSHSGSGGKTYCPDSITKKFQVVANSVSTFTFSQKGTLVTFNPVDTISANTHMWHFGDGDSSSLIIPTHNYKVDSGLYTVCHQVINWFGCGGDSIKCQKINLRAGFNEIEKNNFTVYPNPTTGVVQVQFKHPISNAALSVFNLVGEKVLNLEDISGQNITVDMSKLSSGVYFILVNSDEGAATQKILLTK